MGEGERAEEERGGRVVPFPTPSREAAVTFTRDELRLILNLYGRMVAAGEWRDYAIDLGRSAATFSVYRRTAEAPLYRIVKDPKLARRQGAYSLHAASGLVLKRGHDLSRVLAAAAGPLRLVTG